MKKTKLSGLSSTLAILKDYMLLIWSGVIVLVAIILLVTTPLLLGNKLEKDIVSNSLSPGKKVDNTKEVIPADQYKEVQKHLEQFRNDANTVSRMIANSCKRDLLSYDLFPKPQSSSNFIFDKFGENYRNALESQISSINGGLCPTTTELSKFSKKAASQKGGFRRRIVSSNIELDPEIEEAICISKAKGLSVYAKPEDIAGYKFWENYSVTLKFENSVADCWHWQVGYWCIEDVFSTIQEMNKNSMNVLESPVKRLMVASFIPSEEALSSKTSRGIATEGAANMPKYVFSEENALSELTTGRRCNDVIDVVHFNIIVVVEAKSVNGFMSELLSAKDHIFKGYDGQQPAQHFKHNQISILQFVSRPVDRTEDLHKYYRYGEEAVVELDLVCEYIFQKKAYDSIMPDLVKDFIKQRGSTTGRRR